MFMGTPHQGGEDTSLGSKVLSVASIYYNTNKNLLQHMEKDSERVASLLLEYQGMQGEFENKFAYETLATPRGPLKPAVVSILAVYIPSTMMINVFRLCQSPPPSYLGRLGQKPSLLLQITSEWSNSLLRPTRISVR